MKKHWKWLVPLVLLVAALAGWQWYTRPMTLEQLTPGFDWDGVAGAQGWYTPGVGQDIPQTNIVSADEPDVRALVQALRGSTVRRGISRDSYPAILSDGRLLGTSLVLNDGQSALHLNLYGYYLTMDFSGPDAPTQARRTCSLTDQSPNWQDWAAFIDAHRES